MPFADTLRDVVDNTEGALAGLLMDFEGIAVESYIKDRESFDIDVVGAEFSVIVKSVRRAIESLEAGGTRELAVQAEKVVTLIRIVNDDYFVALTMKPEGNQGKGRFLLRIAVPKLLEDLS
jgi:predicted regulator of Ras-like GTPase activity (Roadblock/LC7/MglB family)